VSSISWTKTIGCIKEIIALFFLISHSIKSNDRQGTTFSMWE
jgi:hypothetical protein